LIAWRPTLSPKNVRQKVKTKKTTAKKPCINERKTLQKKRGQNDVKLTELSRLIRFGVTDFVG
jgi:hypothetical protein